MITIFSYLILFLYSLAIILIFSGGLAQFNLLINYYKSKKTPYNATEVFLTFIIDYNYSVAYF
jgi:hypothetical protein